MAYSSHREEKHYAEPAWIQPKYGWEKFARLAVITASQNSENTHSREESVNGEW